MRTDRQQEILTAAVRVVERDGFSGLTVRKVADEVGVSEPALYRHFANKLELMETILDDFQEAVVFHFEKLGKTTVEDPINEFVAGLFSTLGNRESLAPLIFSEEAFHAEPALKSKLFTMVTSNLQMLTKSLKSLQSKKNLRTDIDTQSLALLIMGTIRVTITRSSLSNGTVRLQDQIETVSKLLSTVLGR